MAALAAAAASAAPGPSHRTLVTSFGGVGTSALMTALSASGALLNDDGDGRKHLPFGRLMSEKASHLMKRPQVSRILYVYDDPTDAVMSLFRNGYSWDQLEKTRRELTAPNAPETVHEYAERKDDPFQLEAHFDSFASQHTYATQADHVAPCTHLDCAPCPRCWQVPHRLRPAVPRAAAPWGPRRFSAAQSDAAPLPP